jgi:hypothetical protein
MTNPAVSILAAGAALACLAIAPQARSAEPRRLVLSQPASLEADIPSLPRIASPATEASAKVNAALARADARWRTSAGVCRSVVPKPTDAEMERTTNVTMRGPGFFSVLDNQEYSCGGAHPDGASIALVYDLDTGRPVNWMTLLPASMKAVASLDTAADGSTMGVVSSPVLHDLYLKAPKPGLSDDDRAACADAVDAPSLTFMLWPDAKADAVVIAPSSLPHVVQTCGAPAAISTATLRKLGVGARMLDAIDAAHAAIR